MANFLMCCLALFISGYCGMYALKIYREDNKPGAIAVGVLGLLSITSPITILIQ